MLLLIYGVGLPPLYRHYPIKPEKSREKVAETAEITKTAPKLSPKASKDPAKSS